MSVDLVNRDPNNIQDHLKVTFEEVFAEPEGAHSFDFVWKLSYTCFTCWLSLCYKISTLCFGICIAAEWGCEFAQIAFYHIWYLGPILRVIEINCGVCKRLCQNCTGCFIEPCCEACGAVFNAFKKN